MLQNKGFPNFGSHLWKTGRMFIEMLTDKKSLLQFKSHLDTEPDSGSLDFGFRPDRLGGGLRCPSVFVISDVLLYFETRAPQI